MGAVIVAKRKIGATQRRICGALSVVEVLQYLHNPIRGSSYCFPSLFAGVLDQSQNMTAQMKCFG